MEEYLPEFYKQVRDRYPKVHSHYQELAESCHEGGPIPEKERQLIKLGIAVGARLEEGVRSHARQALRSGATPEEVRHVGLLALTTVGFPTMVAALSWMEDVLTPRGKVRARK